MRGGLVEKCASGRQLGRPEVSRIRRTTSKPCSLVQSAEKRLRHAGIENVSLRVGDGSRGWTDHAPYDKIIVAAGAKEVPPPLIAQLKPGGRLVMPLGPAEDQRLSVIEKGADDGVKARAIMPVRFSELER